jgi:hypothetical protein
MRFPAFIAALGFLACATPALAGFGTGGEVINVRTWCACTQHRPMRDCSPTGTATRRWAAQIYKFGTMYNGFGPTPRQARAMAINNFVNRMGGANSADGSYTFRPFTERPPVGPINGKCLVRRGF